MSANDQEDDDQNHDLDINEQKNVGSEKLFDTPISTLQEYCRKLGKTPQYDLTALEGKGHQPLFVYRCMVGDISASGQGSSKKQAKHAASKAVLKILTADSHTEEEHTRDSEPNLSVVSKSLMPQEPDQTNPVGSLQELVVAHGWRLPEYSLASETGPAHKKEFIICCTVETFKECGSGSAKKHAKRLAAAKMYRRIIGLPPEAKENITSHSREAKSKVSFNELLNSLGEKLNSLPQSPEALKYPCQTLFDLSQKNNFEVVYKDIKCSTNNGSKQCLLELHTQPISIMHGNGKSFEEAHSDAARYALEYLSILTNEESIHSEDLDK